MKIAALFFMTKLKRVGNKNKQKWSSCWQINTTFALALLWKYAVDKGISGSGNVIYYSVFK